MNREMEKEKVYIRKVKKADTPIIEVWLNKEYIKKWYGKPDEWLEEINNVKGEYNWINHYVVEYKNVLIGFCQYFDCSRTSKGFEWDNESIGTFGIDYFIGEERYLNKGLASIIIQKLKELIITTESPKQIIADPVAENIVSIKLLEKNGFILDELTGLYKLAL